MSFPPEYTATDYINTLLQRSLNNKTLTVTLFKKLFSELPVQSSEIRASLERKEITSAYEVAHNLHGSVSFCGLSDMQSSAYSLETCIIERNTVKALLHLQMLENQILHLLQSKDAILRQLNSE